MFSPQYNSVQLFKSYAGVTMISQSLSCYVRVVVFEECQALFIDIFILSFNKKKTSHVLDSSFSNEFILINIRELLTLIVLLISKRPLSEILAARRDPCIACGTCNEGLRFIDGFKFIRWERSMGNVSTVQTWIIYIILSHAKCVNDQGTKLGGINVP